MSDVEPSGGGGDVTAELEGAPEEKSKTDKITILLKATANAPIMKKRKWLVEPDKNIASINQFIRKLLHLEDSDSLFLYVNQSFAPSPDQTIRNLYACFETDGKLILHYCTTQAWG
ncbi:hypothetical protein GE061_004137 [Apolygus lucorum]|uniref:Ubiquitin-like protein ATG12 n=1 Tax=Apolygus lucorum TaxID=248454 RepID=A0A8S9WYD3_APOLU|nr:hypothetical protein GE061_004137 [Apolygus lucorum]